MWAFFFVLFSHVVTPRGLEVTAGTGKHACPPAPPPPTVSMLRHGQMSVKANLASSWALPLLLSLHNLLISRSHVQLFAFGIGSRPCSLTRALVSASQQRFYSTSQLGDSKWVLWGRGLRGGGGGGGGVVNPVVC